MTILLNKYNKNSCKHYSLRICNSNASGCWTINFFASLTTKARYPPPPAPGIFHANTSSPHYNEQ